MTALERTRVGTVVIAAAIAVVGAAGLVVAVARDVGFTDARGALMGWPDFELGLLTVNPLGALLTLVVGLTALAGAVLRRWRAVMGAAVALLAMSIQVIVQWGGSANWLASRGSNLSFWFGGAVGLVALARAARRLEDESERCPSARAQAGPGDPGLAARRVL